MEIWVVSDNSPCAASGLDSSAEAKPEQTTPSAAAQLHQLPRRQQIGFFTLS